tara:strand:+ start:1187 stop:1399 length:213 start_codon:yes stop_codon:yes gene_type:complete
MKLFMTYKTRKRKGMTHGGIYGRVKGWAWEYRMNGIRKSKYMLDKEKLEKYRDEIIKKYEYEKFKKELYD